MTAPARTWTELAIEIDAEASELLASEISELTGGVEVRDAGTLLRAGEGRAMIVTQCVPRRPTRWSRSSRMFVRARARPACASTP